MGPARVSTGPAHVPGCTSDPPQTEATRRSGCGLLETTARWPTTAPPKHPNTTCWSHRALHPRLTLRPAKNIDSGPGLPGDFPISESHTCEQNKHVFSTEQSAELATKNKSELVTSTRPALSLRGATHRTKHDASLPKPYKNVNGQPTARGAARNRLPSCTEHTTSNPGNEAKTTHLIFAAT